MNYIDRAILKESVVSDYNNGIKRNEISIQYNLSRQSVGRILRSCGIFNKPRRINPCGKYEIDHSFFDVIDTEEKAYFFGFLCSDGCNHSNRNDVSLTLNLCDRHILDELSAIIKSNRKFEYRKKRKPAHSDALTLRMNSKRISERLTELGCTPNKSLTLRFPKDEDIPQNLVRHFIRGYFDGDGSYCTINLKNKNVLGHKFTIVSSTYFCMTLKEVLTAHLGIHHVKVYQCNNPKTSVLHITSKKDIWTILDWMYKDSTIKLNRKYENFKVNEPLLRSYYGKVY